MDRKRAAAALLVLAACIACSTAAPTASNQTALELMDGPTEGCYYNFQHYGEGDRIMTNEPCLNCTCHNRMLMCYLKVCPFTKPIGQDCTVEKRADQCCPIVTCPDVPVDLLTSTSTSSPAEYGTTGVGKLDKYGCSINGIFFSEGSKVPSSPNKPCEHCYCIRNMTTCVMQECTLHVDGCTPIYHKEVCCPVRYSCDHPEDEILLLDDMTTTVRPTPGFLLTTTTAMPVTQMTQDCVHDDQIFPDGTLIKTEKACEHCYCMKGDIVCVVQECGTPMENEGKNCTSLPPRIGQCCPDTYICEGDDRGTEFTTEIVDQSTQPPRRMGVEGSGYTIEQEEPLTETSPFETDIEGSGEEYATDAPKITVEHIITEKTEPEIIDEMLIATTEKEQLGHVPKADKDENIVTDIISDTESSDLPDMIAQTTEAIVVFASTETESKITVADEYKTDNELTTKEDVFVTTESAFRKEDSNIVSDEMLTIKEQEVLPTTSTDLVDDTTQRDEKLNTDDLQLVDQSTTLLIEPTSEIVTLDNTKDKEIILGDKSQSTSTEKNKLENGLTEIPIEEILSDTTTIAIEKIDTADTTPVSTFVNEIDKNIPLIPSPGRIPGEGDCLLNGITYKNNTIVPSSNNCHTSCKCASSIIKCDPIICSSPPEYMENMNDCQPIYDSPDACCPTYVCSGKETIPPQSHSQMSGTETPKPVDVSDCNGQQCILGEKQKATSEPTSSCTSEECLHKPVQKQDKDDCGSNNCTIQPQKPISQDCPNNNCQIQPVVACEDGKCIKESESSSDLHDKPIVENIPPLDCNENGDCKKPEGTIQTECTDEICTKQESMEIEQKLPSLCTGTMCTQDQPILHATTEQTIDVKTEKISTDSTIHISINELDTDKESVSETTSATIDENRTENPTVTDTKLTETLPSEELTTISNTHDMTEKSDITVVPVIQNISDKEEDTKVTEETGIEYVTGSSVEIGKDKDTKVTQPDQTYINTEKVDSESTEKTEIATEKLGTVPDANLHEQMYTTISESDSENQEVHTNIPYINENDLEKLSTEPTVSSSEKEITIQEDLNIFEDQDKIKLPVTIDAENTQTENIITGFNKGTEIYETSQSTSGTPERFEDFTVNEKGTETTESHIIMTDKNNGEIADVTPSVYLETKYEDVFTDKTNINTESHVIVTEQPTVTKEEEISKDVTQYIPKDEHEKHTESYDQYTTKVEATTSNIPIHETDKIAPTEIQSKVTEESLTEKVTTMAESSETSPTKTNEIEQEVEKQKPVSQEIHIEVPEKSDESSTLLISEKEVDTVTENKFAVTTESNIPKETFTEISKTHSTITQDFITKNYDTITQSLTEQPSLSTILPVTMKETEEDTHTSSDINTTPKIVKLPTTKADEQYMEETDAGITTSTPVQTISETDSFKQTENDGTKDIDKQDFESHILPTTIKYSEVFHEISTVTQELITEIDDHTKPPLLTDEKSQEPATDGHEEILSHTYDNDIVKTTQAQIPLTESQTESPLGTDEKSQESTTDIQEELYLQTDINEIDTATEQHLTVTEVQTKSPLVTDEKSQEPATEIHEELLSQTDINEIDTATEQHLAVTEVHTKSPLAADEKLQEPATETHEELPLQTDINKIDTATEHLAVTEFHTTSPLITDVKLHEPAPVTHEHLPSQSDIETATHEFIAVTESQTNSPLATKEKPQDTVTDILEELPLQTDINEIDTTTEQHLAVTESETTSSILTDGKQEKPAAEIHEELVSQTDVNNIDTATQEFIAVTEDLTQSPLITNAITQEPVTDIREELPVHIDNNEIDTATEEHIAVTESETRYPVIIDDKLQEPVTEKHEFPSQTDTNDIDTATQEHVAITESETNSPLVTDEKSQEPTIDTQELTSPNDSNDIETATQEHITVTENETKSPLVTDKESPKPMSDIHTIKPNESIITSSPYSETDSGFTKENYVTESQKISTEIEEGSQTDSPTAPFIIDHKLEESIDTGKRHEEADVTETAITTISSQGEEENESTLFVPSDVTFQDLEKTTASLISIEDKGTESLLHVTESYIDDAKEKETIKTTAGLITEKEVSGTTETSVSDEDLQHITSQPPHEVIPEQGFTQTEVSQTSQDVYTENNHPLDSYETHDSTDSSTKQPDLFTKSEELGLTESTLDEKEKEIMPETSEDFNKISTAPTDQKYSNTDKPSEDHDQILTTPVAVKVEEDKDPIPFITDMDQVTEISSEEKNKINTESSTTADQDSKENTISDLYNPELQTETSEKVKDVITEHEDSDTDKMLMTEIPEYLPTSHVHEITVPPSEEEIKITQQKTTTEKILENTELNNEHPTLSELNAHDTEKTSDSTGKEGTINVEESKTTTKSLDDSEKITTPYAEYQTTILPSKDDIPDDLPHKEFTTLAPESVEREHDDITETLIFSQKPTTSYPEIITEKEKSTGTIDLESHIVTTVKPLETEVKVDEGIKYTTTELIFTDKFTDAVTESKESDIMKQEHSTDGTTEKSITEKQEITESESLTKGIETTDSQYTTLVEQKESSAGVSYMTDKPQEDIIKDDETLAMKPHEVIPIIIQDTGIKDTYSTVVPYHTEMTTSSIDSQSELYNKQKLTTQETTDINIETTKSTIIEKENVDHPEISYTQSSEKLHTEEHITQKEADIITTESVLPTGSNIDIAAEQPTSTAKQEEPYIAGENYHTIDLEQKVSETTPFLVELEEHTHLMADETSTKVPLEEIATTTLYETHESPQPERGDQISESLDSPTISGDEYPQSETSKTTTSPSDDKGQPTSHLEGQIDDNALTTINAIKTETDITLITEKTPTSTSAYVSYETKKDTDAYGDQVVVTTTLQTIKDKDYTTESTDLHQTPSTILGNVQSSSEKVTHMSSEYPLQQSEEKLTSEVSKQTTPKLVNEESTTQPSYVDKVTKPKEKPVETTLRPAIPDVPKPEFIDEHNEEIPSPDFPPSGGYGQEPDYIDEDQAFGPGTCRYGGKVYVSAQQIPRDDPCDFCFCFRSDIICLQQSCPPPIHGCHEEPIQGFCCPRYECPVSMATTLNVTTTTTTTTTTLPPHFLPHAYKGAAQRRGCQIKGHTYKVGEVVRASSGPCLHCTCGGDGQMKCDPKACTPEPMLRQMIAAAVSAKRRR